uniref:Uncharacterized protein n=1 Tax=uncultured organism MedDCM-OCT-S01-C81 TaxID=743603 RepID=D6PJL6_9ZZZZ|nr:hypothetical protein [uncultured organism MedDCM-OCT-S01-C81]
MALYGEPAQNVSDLLSFGDSLGEPEGADMAGTMDDDFESIMARKRKRLTVIFGSAGGVLLLGLLMYLVTPGIFDATIGPYLGIKARINPEAIPLVEQGVQRMLDDVPLAYDEAIVKFEEALAIDRDYPQAIGLVTLAYMFRGADLKAKAQAIRAQAEEKITQITKLQKRAGRSRRVGPKIRDLRSAVQKLSDRSTKVNEEGAAKFTKGQKWSKEGMKKFAKWPLVVMSAGILQFEADPDKLQSAEKFMKAGKKYLDKKKGDKALDEAFAAMLDARLLQRVKKEPKQAINLLRSALTKEERFQRARYMLALLLADTGAAEEAKKEAERVLEAVEDHKGAKAILGS